MTMSASTSAVTASKKRSSWDVSSSATSSDNITTTSTTSNNSCPLDCQSLQSSLKRVRLSCSPGQLRLQRDLKALVLTEGWTQIDDSNYELEAANGSNIRLSQVDPLRMVLTIPLQFHQQQQQVAHCWIQIPRRYPHRPPNIPRIDFPGQSQFHSPPAAVQHIVVTEAPPVTTCTDDDDVQQQRQAEEVLSVSPSKTAQQLSCGGSTVCFEWSPVHMLSDLLNFVLQVLPPQSRNIHGMNMYMQPPTNDNSPPTYVSPRYFQGQHERALDTDNTAMFLEEHKMEESSSTTSGVSVFPPNRFETGYGKYLEPVASTQASNICNPMDII